MREHNHKIQSEYLSAYWVSCAPRSHLVLVKWVVNLTDTSLLWWLANEFSKCICILCVCMCDDLLFKLKKNLLSIKIKMIICSKGNGHPANTKVIIMKINSKGLDICWAFNLFAILNNAFKWFRYVIRKGADWVYTNGRLRNSTKFST